MAVSGLLAECSLHRLSDFELVLSVHFSFSSCETVSNSSLLSGGKALGSAPRHKPADCGTGPGGTEPEKAMLGVGLAGTPALRPRRERGHLPTERCALGYPHQDLKPGCLTSAPLCCLCLEIGPEF